MTRSAEAQPELERLSRGFRRDYLDYAELTRQVRAWADAFPEVVRLRSIGQSREGRDIWMLTIGADPDRARPGVWVDGNLHASELAGSSVALAIAEDAIALQLSERENGAPSGLKQIRRCAREALFHVVPRISPDGAEAVLKSARYVRSVPRDGRAERQHPRWIHEDVDGDGLALSMRKEDPTGEWVESSDAPSLMVPRTLEDSPPYYKLWPEGRIEHWDGANVPTPDYLSDNHPDLNRNFPFHWEPEHKQKGAGDFAGSEPESRAVIEQAMRLPTLHAWLNLHTFGGCFIRPPGDVPDEKMDPFDLGVYRQVGAWAEELTSYPMVSGYAEFLYEPGKPLYGALSEWAYEHRGCLSYVCELWDLFARLGMKRPAKFADFYTHMTRADLVAFARWDAAHNRSRVLRPWVRVTHPQLGEVEVGGVDRRVGITNPPYEELPAICEKQSALMMRVAAMLPRVVVSRVEVTPLRENVTAVSLVVENHGYLPTYGMRHTRSQPWNEPLWADANGDGVTLEDPAEKHRLVGHLEGWGRGLFDPSHALFYAKSSGSDSSRTLRYVARGKGWLTVRIGSARVGFIERRVGIGGGV